MAIKFIEVEKVPEKRESIGELIDAFIASGLQNIKLDLSDEERPKQVIYSNIYNAIRNKTLSVKVQMIDGEIYLQRTDTPVDPQTIITDNV